MAVEKSMRKYPQKYYKLTGTGAAGFTAAGSGTVYYGNKKRK